MQCPNCKNEIPADAKFCTFCGHALAGQPSPAGTTTAPSAQAVVPTAVGSRWRWLLLGLGLLAVVVLGSMFISRIMGNERILYAVQDEGPFDLVNAIMIMDENGEEIRELAYDRDGLFVPGSGYGDSPYLAPDGRWFAYFEQTDDGWELVLTSTEGGGALLVDEEAVRSPTFGALGFSPDSRYFAYTTYSERTEDVNLHLVDKTGAMVLTLPDAAFGGFFPDSQRILIIETDEEGLFDSLAWVDLNDGTPNRITHLASSSGWIRPVVLPDGSRVAFYSDDELLVIDVDGGGAQRLHEFDSRSSAIFLAPGDEQLVVYDQFEGERFGELRLIGLVDNSSSRLGRDVVLGPWGNRPNEPVVDFSPDGELVAYLGGRSGDLDLYVTDIDGRNRRRISNDNAWSTFTFSPRGGQIAFIEASDSRRPGTLYIADADGSNRLRLDVDVWSFRFIDSGRRIIYSKVADMNRGDPESEIYRTDVDGDNQELILGVQNGIISFLDVLD